VATAASVYLGSLPVGISVILAGFTDWAGLAVALCGLLVALGGFYYPGRQLLHSQRSAQGSFLLDLEHVMRQHDEVHRKPDSPAGKRWAPLDEEWPAIEAYMGVFERIQLLVEEKILDLETVDRLYSYRMISIIRNDHIRREKLVEKDAFWPFFCDPWESLQGCKYWKLNLEYHGESTASCARRPQTD
jgi:hypothetical protein